MKSPVYVVGISSQEREAANEEFVEAPALDKMVGGTTPGWDPFEVWRTRVKDDLRLHERESRSA